MRVSDEVKVLGAVAILLTLLALHYYGNVAVLEYLREQQAKMATTESAE